MNTVAHYKEVSLSQLKKEIFRETSSLIEQLEYLYAVQKSLINEITKCVLQDKSDYPQLLEKYKIISSLIDNVQKQRKEAINSLKPIAELEKASYEIPTVQPLMIDVRS